MPRYYSLLLIILMIYSSALTQDKSKYVPYQPDSVLKEMIEENKAASKKDKEQTKDIRDRQEIEEKEKKAERKRLRPFIDNVRKPGLPESFKQEFHFPPVAQYLTGTCWDFATTSFFESEIYRAGKEKIKLSEMYTVYFEYVEKARRFIRERGKSAFSQGSQANALVNIWRKYGVVPADAYTGLCCGRTRHDHSHLIRELKSYLKFLKEKDLWDEETALEMIKVILNKYLGEPPISFSYNGKDYTPFQFLQSLPINLEDYVAVISTKSIPFYTQGSYNVPDNWWLSEDYYNLPLDAFYDVILTSLKMGQTISIGGDVSEPGYYGEEDICFIPTFDIPAENINQDSREFRFYNRTSTDDHLIHIVGYKKVDGVDWFLIKDSARSARSGKYKGYLFYRGEYIKLKTLTFIVHKSAIEKYLEKFED